VTDAARHRAALALIVIAWAVSLLLPALTVRGGPTLSGFDLLTQGWQGVSRGVLAWYANPLFAVAVLAAAANRARAAGVAAGVAVVLALTSFAAEDMLGRQMPSVPDLELRAGFFVWAAALIAMFIWSWLRVYLQRSNDVRGQRGAESFHFRD
jgi:hypothetical protein